MKLGAEILGALRGVVGDVPGELAFLLGGLFESLHIRMRRRRKGERNKHRKAANPFIVPPRTRCLLPRRKPFEGVSLPQSVYNGCYLNWNSAM